MPRKAPRPTKKEDENEPLFVTLKRLIHSQLYITRVPSFANSIWFSFGFLLMITFVMQVITGVIMLFFGSAWWQYNPWGIFVRSMHLWGAEAFVVCLIAHVFVNVSVSAYRGKRKWLWVIGTAIFGLVMLEASMGFGVIGGFMSQWTVLNAQDLWNGTGLGFIINLLNSFQLLMIHTLIIPLVLVLLIAVHFLLVKEYGIAKPHIKNIQWKMVEADHKALYERAVALVMIILFLSVFVQAPFLPPLTIQHIAQQNPGMIAVTLLSEFNYSSGTATYFDTIDPYTFSTRTVFVTAPYSQYMQANGGQNLTSIFNSENSSTQSANINQAFTYFSDNNSINTSYNAKNPLIPMISSLVVMSQSGLYDASLQNALPPGDNTYIDRFLADSGAPDAQANSLGMQLDQWGLGRDVNGYYTDWWSEAYNGISLALNGNDLYGGIVLGSLLLLMAIFPIIPFINRIPDYLGMYKLFWKKKKGKK